jgi:flagellar hook-basal body complex protein FliE
MDAISTNQLLTQLREMAQQAGAAGDLTKAPQSGGEFALLLKQSIKQVNERQKTAAKLAERFEMEDPSVDLSQVMVEKQKASIAFEALIQVRKNLLTAYKDIMNMPM